MARIATNEDPAFLDDPSDTYISDITAQLEKIMAEDRAKRSEAKTLQIGDQLFKLRGSVTGPALAQLSRSSGSGKGMVDVDAFIEGTILLFANEDRQRVRDYIDEEDLTIEAIALIMETALETVSGKG